MELIRRILVLAEDQPVPKEGDAPDSSFLSVDGYDDVTVARHVELLEEAGLVRANLFEIDSFGVIGARVERLTWQGHEFLDAAKNDTVWQRTMAVVKDKGGSVPFGVFQEIMVGVAKIVFGLPG
jgi:hypothetical protein